jgi:hypothetical protein
MDVEPLDYAVTQLATNEPDLQVDKWEVVSAYLVGKNFNLRQLNKRRDHIMGLLSKIRSSGFPPSPPLNGISPPILDPAVPLENSSSIDAVSRIPA